jgi:hypothetical protein
MPRARPPIYSGGLLSNLTFNVAVSNENNATSDTLVKLTKTPTNSLTGTINRKTGLLSITFGNGVKATTTVGMGAVLQNSNSAAGFFLNKTNAGSIFLP